MSSKVFKANFVGAKLKFHPVLSGFPIASLDKNMDLKQRIFNFSGKEVKISPTIYGRFTIYDLRLIFLILGELMNAQEESLEISNRVNLKVAAYFLAIGKGSGGNQYREILDVIRRLATTSIEIKSKDTKYKNYKNFSLLNDTEIVSLGSTDNLLDVTVTISDVLYSAVQGKSVLTLNPIYLRLTSPIEMRLFEYFDMRTGVSGFHTIGLKKLHQISGSLSPFKSFSYEIRSLLNSDSKKYIQLKKAFQFELYKGRKANLYVKRLIPKRRSK